MVVLAAHSVSSKERCALSLCLCLCLCLRWFTDPCHARLQFIVLLKAKAAKAVAKPKAPVAKHKAQIEKYRV